MKLNVNENQVVIAGRVGSTRLIAGGRILLLNVKVGRSAEDWEAIRLTDRVDGSAGNKSRFERFGEVGQYVVAVCNETQNGEYRNYWVNRLEIGPQTSQRENTLSQ